MDRHEDRGMASTDATLFLRQLADGDPSAAERLLPLVYDNLRALAGGAFRGVRSDHTLQPTALVHEVFIRLVDQANVNWQDRSHFLAVSARAMRMILADYARRRGADKRGGQWTRVEIDLPTTETGATQLDLIAVDEALTKLAALDERHARIVELRFFTGLTVAEVAGVMKCSPSSIEREWRAIRAWLNLELDTE
jgi:RNA polymerase sigma factor (TIGR02999 family)